MTFDLKNFKDWKALRFDPLEGKPCICRIDHAGTNAKLKAANASGKVEHGDLFLTTDPVYLVKMEENKDQVKISGMMCGMCEAHICDVIRARFAVRKVTASHSKGQAVILSESGLDEAVLRQAIAETGYEVTAVSARPAGEKKGLFGFLKR